MDQSEDRTWRTVVLSPHFDDAGLSLAGVLPLLPRPAAVVTVYGGPPAPEAKTSWWDTVSGFSSATEAHRHRRAEDARACALLGAEQVVLDHPDGPYADSRDLDGLGTFLRGLPPTTRVLVPLGSNQPDHEAVRDRALRVLAEHGAPLPWVYADLPYTGHLPEWGTDAADAALARSPRCGLAYQDLLRAYRTTVQHDLRLTDEQWAAKREAVLCYASQLAPLAPDHGMFLAHGGPLGAELVWSLEPLSAAARTEAPC